MLTLDLKFCASRTHSSAVHMQRITRVQLLLSQSVDDGTPRFPLGDVSAASATFGDGVARWMSPCSRWCSSRLRLPPALHTLLKNVVHTVSFECAAMLVIVANAALLSLDRYNISEDELTALRFGNYVLTALFAVEVAMRWGASDRHYLRTSRIAQFDLLVLCISILDILAQTSGLAQRYSRLNSLRLIRSFRVLRLVRLSSGFMEVFGRIAQAVPSALSASALLMVFMLTAALVGMQVRHCCATPDTRLKLSKGCRILGVWRRLYSKSQRAPRRRSAASQFSGTVCVLAPIVAVFYGTICNITRRVFGGAS